MGRTCLSADLKSEISISVFLHWTLTCWLSLCRRKELVPFFACRCCSLDVAAGGQLWDNGRDAGLRLVLFCIFLKDTAYLHSFIYIL